MANLIFFLNKLLCILQQIGTGKDHERDPSERAYNLVTKAYFGSKEYRNAHRLVTYHLYSSDTKFYLSD